LHAINCGCNHGFSRNETEPAKLTIFNIRATHGREWILMKQEMMEWQWHQLDHMQIICTSLQTDNHASTSSLNFTGRMIFLTLNQQCQITEGKS